MVTSGIDAGQISAMLSQLKSYAVQAQSPQAVGQFASMLTPEASGSQPVSFADVLKNSLNQVNQVQQQADQMGNRFASGDNSVSLSQTMIAMQKANISFQEAVQVRDRLVTAYTAIMNMQV